MSSQVAPPQHARSAIASNGGNRRRVDRDPGSSGPSRSDSANWRSSGNSQSTRMGGTGGGNGNNNNNNSRGGNSSLSLGNAHPGAAGGGGGGSGSGKSGGDRGQVSHSVGSGGRDEPLGAFKDGTAHDRFVLMATCLIGQTVEVQTKSGIVYTGIFHTANDRDFGVVLKMVKPTKDLSNSRSSLVREASRKPPSKMMIIQAKDCVQVIAKDVVLDGESLANGKFREIKGELATDTGISKSGRTLEERELKPWRPEPGEEASRNLRLDSTFSGGAWGRNWDQFEANKSLFGVESSFDENMYTTKLEKQSKEREREAARIAREIEGQSSRNVHLAEERGQQLPSEVEEMDEETRFSSVIRENGEEIDSGEGEDEEDGELDVHNDDTFGPSTPEQQPPKVEIPPESFPASKENPTTKSDGQASTSGVGNSGGGRVRKDEPTTPTQERKVGGFEPSPRIDQEEQSALEAAAQFHKEHLRLRLHPKRASNSFSKATGGSPYHSPVGRRSPLLSPLMGDAASIHALNLDPSTPQVPEEVYRDFADFKKQETAKKSKKGREDQVNELKSFSESLRERTAIEPRSPLAPRTSGQETPPPGSSKLIHSESASRGPASPDPFSRTSMSPFSAHRPTTPSSATSPAGTPTPASKETSVSRENSFLKTSISEMSSVESSPGTPVAGSRGGGGGGGGGENLNGSTLNVTAGGSLESGSNPAVTAVASGTNSSSSASSSSTSSQVAPAKKSTLNPNAKEFKLNPNAKVFTPGTSPFTPPSSSPSPSSSAPNQQHSGNGNIPRPMNPNPNLVSGPMFLPASMGGMQIPGLVGGFVPQNSPNQLNQLQNMGNSHGHFPGSFNPAMVYIQGGGGGVGGGGGPPGNFGVPGGIPGAVLQGQPGMKMPPHSQNQMGPMYVQQPGVRGYPPPPQGPQMQAGPPYLYPNGQQYPQGVMYGPQGQMVYMHPMPQQMMPGQSMVPPQQGGPPPPLPHPGSGSGPKHRGGPMPVQFHGPGGAPPFVPGGQNHSLPPPPPPMISQHGPQHHIGGGVPLPPPVPGPPQGPPNGGGPMGNGRGSGIKSGGNN